MFERMDCSNDLTVEGKFECNGCVSMLSWFVMLLVLTVRVCVGGCERMFHLPKWWHMCFYEILVTCIVSMHSDVLLLLLTASRGEEFFLF